MSSTKQDAMSLNASITVIENMNLEKGNADHVDPRSTPEWIEVEKKLVRKLDLSLLPMLWILYMFNYLDRNNIRQVSHPRYPAEAIDALTPVSQARLNSFEKDLGLVGNEFNVAVSILNVGYMLAQLPSNMILTRVRPSLYLPACVAVWSCVSAATSTAGSYNSLVVIRFFLGIVEAPFFPGAFYLLSCWYTRRELALRTAVLYSGLVLATAFSGLIAAGIFAGLDNARGIAGWKWLFIIEGTGSFVAAIVAIFILPDYPDSKKGSGAWLFTLAERKIAEERMLLDRVSLPEADRSVWVGLRMAVMDYRTWIFALLLAQTTLHMASITSSPLHRILKGFNIGDNTVTLVLTAPPYLVGAAVSFLVAYSSDRLGERGYHISIPMLVAAIGFIISVATLNVPARYFASFLYASGSFAANSMVYSWGASVLNQTPEKRACTAAIINLSAQFGNIWSPYFFPSRDGPRYTMAMLLMLGFSILSIICALSMKMILRRANKKLAAEADRTGQQLTLHIL